MFETMIPSPLSFFAVFSKKSIVVLCSVFSSLLFFVVPSYIRDYDSKSFVVLCDV